jgi:hypothetical protein
VTNPFDIIRVLSDDRLAWMEAAEELSAARVRVWQLLANSPGEYIIFNQHSKTLVAHFSIHEAPESFELVGLDDDYLQQGVAAVPALPDDYDEYLEEIEPAVA